MLKKASAKSLKDGAPKDALDILTEDGIKTIRKRIKDEKITAAKTLKEISAKGRGNSNLKELYKLNDKIIKIVNKKMKE